MTCQVQLLRIVPQCGLSPLDRPAAALYLYYLLVTFSSRSFSFHPRPPLASISTFNLRSMRWVGGGGGWSLAMTNSHASPRVLPVVSTNALSELFSRKHFFRNSKNFKNSFFRVSRSKSSDRRTVTIVWMVIDRGLEKRDWKNGIACDDETKTKRSRRWLVTSHGYFLAPSSRVARGRSRDDNQRRPEFAKYREKE